MRGLRDLGFRDRGRTMKSEWGYLKPDSPPSLPGETGISLRESNFVHTSPNTLPTPETYHTLMYRVSMHRSWRGAAG